MININIDINMTINFAITAFILAQFLWKRNMKKRRYNMKRWERYDNPSGRETYNLFFGHHNGGEERIVCLFRDEEGDWRTTSDLLGTYWTWLKTGAAPVHDAKLLVENMVYEHYGNEAQYYQEICDEFAEG